MKQLYQIKTLENGVRLLTEEVPGVRSSSIGIWVGSGSRQEASSEQGAAHFIEHMYFKGTESRSAADLAMEMDAIGGQQNAFTTKENTCYYARTLDTHLPKAIELLCDMFFKSRFAEEDTAMERGVILEEIRMYQDNPEDVCAERLAEAVYKSTPLAHPILGKPATLKKMTGEWLRAYRDSHYRPDRIVVSLAGSFTQRDIDDLTTRFSAIPKGKDMPEKTAAYTPGITVKKKSIEQNNLILAFPGLPYQDDRRFALQLLSFLLGGGMSSRLFQEVREKRGLCYTVYSYGAGHADTGMFAVYTALGKDTERQALDTIIRVIKELTQDGISPDELNRSREQSKASVLMGMESTQARMSHLGRSALLSGKVMTPDEIIAAYDAVTEEQVLTLAREIFDFNRASLSAVGKVGTAEEYEAILRG
jgi:predicted Zn-dependent peptidase